MYELKIQFIRPIKNFFDCLKIDIAVIPLKASKGWSWSPATSQNDMEFIFCIRCLQYLSAIYLVEMCDRSC